MNKKAKPAMVGKPEVTPSGVQPKNSKSPPKPEVKTKKVSKASNWFRLFVSGVILADMTWGLIGIHEGLAGQEYLSAQINAMWLYGVMHAAALVTILAVKLE